MQANKKDKEMEELKRVAQALFREHPATTREGMREYRRIQRSLDKQKNNYSLRQKWRKIKDLLNQEIESLVEY